MSPLSAYIAAVIVSLSLGFASGWRVNSWKDASDREAREAAIAEAMLTTAQEIAKIEVKNVTIKQKMDTVIREVPVYSECKHTDDGLRMLNEALTGKPADSGKLPGADTAK